MNTAPRKLNRALLALVGLLLVVLGAHLLLSVVLPPYARWAQSVLGAGSPSPSPDLPVWAWILVSVLCVVGAVLALAWAVSQSRGRVTVYSRAVEPSGPARGVVTFGTGVPEAYLKEALGGRSDVVGVHVSAWRPDPATARQARDAMLDAAGLRLRVQPRPGARPERVLRAVETAVEDMDRDLGLSGPVLIHLATGARARMARAERVR